MIFGDVIKDSDTVGHIYSRDVSDSYPKTDSQDVVNIGWIGYSPNRGGYYLQLTNTDKDFPERDVRTLNSLFLAA